jgi:hypothetical protein
MPFWRGSKITHNITGKFAVVQGMEDIKMGLPLQSVMESDLEMYHQPLIICRHTGSVSKGDDILWNEHLKNYLIMNGLLDGDGSIKWDKMHHYQQSLNWVLLVKKQH